MPVIPKKLYKYRPFSTYSVTEIERNEVYYANPKSFNDPMDCSPVIDVDVSTKVLETLCARMLLEKYGGEIGKPEVDADLKRFRYNATEPNEDGSPANVERNYRWYLKGAIEESLVRQMSRHGVLSLAQKWDCPLMWSHYADQHKGICIEYDTSDCRFETPKPVDYSGNRNIKASDLHGFYVEHLQAARERVFDGYFYHKARQWRYEKEWRVVRKGNGVDGSPYKISAIYFGVRCEASVESMIVKLFQGSPYEPKFYRMSEDTKTFKLRRYHPEMEDFLYESPALSTRWREEELKDLFKDESVNTN
ncbi:DUF2971 domain-containing protein [Pandoraea communis]|uniref:DUF2971 domain-containing protein n=1 Tax=Pandoraea communis TaxID=2508297 RepID=UPI0025A4ECF8|nr:DUF2971 domain-containing protein [Pandoraea communis]MDM8356192.1 DUF2971 domain-containing protein [Pandoraea communis]